MKSDHKKPMDFKFQNLGFDFYLWRWFLLELTIAANTFLQTTTYLLIVSNKVKEYYFLYHLI